jgi:tRNA(Met) cytidine acetyltransferase
MTLPPRRLVLVTGPEAAAEAALLRALGDPVPEGLLWVAERAPAWIDATPPGRAAGQLGGECRLLVFNAHQGLHPDGLAAAVGSLRGGGDCVLLAPALADWPHFADPDLARFAAYPRRVEDMHGRFLARLAALLRDHPAVCRVEAGAAPALRWAGPAGSPLCLSAEQEAVIAAVERVARGHAGRPLVLTADRGRGKSTALGVAVARLLAAGFPQISVLAPNRAAAATLLRHAGGDGGADPRLRFLRPADLAAEPGRPLGLVLVDEAAAIPVATLEGLLARSRRLVFASTVHGYEGSGRGFELRFAARLAERMPQLRRMTLTEPVRWPAGDPLEALLDRGLLLDAGLPPVADGSAAEPLIERIRPDDLAADETLLRQVFGLLVAAHYQTRPSDLRQLLDNPDLVLWLARLDGAVAGVLLLGAEGGFDPDMADQVAAGRRRPRGHLLVQSLAVHAGLEDLLRERVLRVQRIAVHPRARRRGIGHAMLAAAAGSGAAEGFSLLGCAYGVDPELLAFWESAGFHAVRLGIRVDPASAAHSLFMLRPLAAAAAGSVREAHDSFLDQLPLSLAGPLRELDAALAARLLRGRPCTDLALSASERRALVRVAQGARQPATAASALWKALLRLAAEGRVEPGRLAPLLGWQVQHRRSAAPDGEKSGAGRGGLEAQLREVIAEHIEHLSGNG